MNRRCTAARNSLIKKILLILLVSPFNLQASIKELSSYKANFTQTIIDQDDVKITYKGTFIALKPLRAVWHYTQPIKKSVYINSQQIVIVEPELEQAIYKRSKNNFTLFNILDDAIQIDKTHYEKQIEDRLYKLTVKDDIIESLTYKDDFDNQVLIVFSEQEANVNLQSRLFHPMISEDYDIIKE